ncbi:MAG: hypothetical protein LBV54_03915, partial [Puniceicoccales bacterium]|nr:hypothetical protein [Puniceicoccales bacterium]
MSKTSFRGPAQIAATMFLLSAGTQLLPAEPLAEEPAPTTQGTGVLTSHPGVSSNCAVIGTWLENDFQWSDKYYTNAIKIAYTTPEVFQNGLPGFMKN